MKSKLKLVERDAKSFGKRAEVCFESRPKLLNFVKEAYKACLGRIIDPDPNRIQISGVRIELYMNLT